MNDQNDVSGLFVKIQNGSEQAFCQLYKLYYNKLFRYGCAISDSESLVEDVIQDLFLRILHRPDKFQHIVNHEVYLFRTIKFNLRRKLQRAERKSAIVQMLYFTSTQKDESIEDKLVNQETHYLRAEAFAKTLDQLPASEKEAIYLRYFEGMDYDQIAKVKSINNQVARNYVSRALKRIKELINKSEVSR